MKYYNGIIRIIALIILTPIVLGKCTFSKTFQLYRDYQYLQSQEKQLEQTASSKPMLTSTRLHNENLISNGQLVELMSRACEENSVSVKQYEPRLLDREGNYKLYTANMVLTGNYISLVKILRYWEDNMLPVKIRSLQFEYDEKKMKDKKVEMTVIMKQIENS